MNAVVAIKPLLSKLSNGELNIVQALEEAYFLGKKEKNEDSEPITVRQGFDKKKYEKLTLADIDWE